MHRLLLALLMLFSHNLMAEQPAQAQLPDLAPPPTGIVEDEILEPEVNIIKRGEDVIEEYRINGELYMVKVIPRRGYTYYLVDTDGDGSLDVRRGELDPMLVVPSWMIYRW